jgi:hypothetical protein
MLYIGLSKGNEETPTELRYYCRDSTHSVEKPVFDREKKTIIVSETQVLKKDFDFSYIVNEFTALDPTLPRLRGMKCPNAECPLASDPKAAEANEVVFLRYDDDALKYIYICPCCGETWKS